MSRMQSGLSVALLVSLAACGGYVKKDDLATQMAQVQAEMDKQNAAIEKNSSDIALMQADIDQMRADMDALAVEMMARIDEMEDGLRFAMPVHFEFDSSDIRIVDQTNLDRFAGVVSRYYPGVIVTVEGFADPAGTAEYNKWLSQQRANNVAAYIVANSTLDASAVKAIEKALLDSDLGITPVVDGKVMRSFGSKMRIAPSFSARISAIAGNTCGSSWA